MTVWGAGLRRLILLMWIMTRHAVALMVSAVSRRVGFTNSLPSFFQLTGPERLRTFFEDLGGTFIKFGQMLALQPDTISPEYCSALYKLLDRVEPFPFSEAKRILRESLGVEPEAIFSHLEPEPFASASVGQVHVAWLRSSGQKVAVKVQRPSVESEFSNDIRLMQLGIRTIQGLKIHFLDWMLEPMSEFVEWTQEELDYRYEARYAEALRHQALNNPKQYVPEIHGEYTTRRTLVMEFLEGRTLLQFLRARERGDQELLDELETFGFDCEQFGANVIDNFLGDVFAYGVYHADLHPANLMILQDNVVGYVDFGIIGVMSPYSRRHLVTMTLALAQGDMDTLGREYVKVSEYGPKSDVEGFRRDLFRIAPPWYEGSGYPTWLQEKFTVVMGDMLNLSRKTRVMPERDIIKYIRSSIAIDGLVSRLEPHFDVGKHLAESCSRLILKHAVLDQFSVAQWLDFSNSSVKLLRDGPARAAKFLDQVNTGHLAFEWQSDPRSESLNNLRQRAVLLGVAALMVCGLIQFSEEPLSFGFNLITAEWIFLGLSGLWLASTVGKLLLER